MPDPCELVDEYASSSEAVSLAIETELTDATVSIAESVALSSAGAAAEAVAIAEALSGDVAVLPTDTVAVTESVSAGTETEDSAGSTVETEESTEISVSVAPQEGVAVTESVSDEIGTGSRDTVVIGETVTGSRTVVVEVEDRIVSADSNERVVGVAVSDTVALSDTTAYFIAADVREQAAVGESLTVGSAVVFSLTDGVAAGESIVAALNAVQPVVEAVRVRDAAPIVDDAALAFWANSETMAAALWNSVPFDSYAQHEGQLYAAGDGGVYLIGGDADGEADIEASLTSDLTDLGSRSRKRFTDVYVGAQAGAPLSVTLATDAGSWSYATHLPSSDSLVNHRARPGKGIAARFARFTLANTDGASFEIRDVHVHFENIHKLG